MMDEGDGDGKWTRDSLQLTSMIIASMASAAETTELLPPRRSQLYDKINNKEVISMSKEALEDHVVLEWTVKLIGRHNAPSLSCFFFLKGTDGNNGDTNVGDDNASNATDEESPPATSTATPLGSFRYFERQQGGGYTEEDGIHPVPLFNIRKVY